MVTIAGDDNALDAHVDALGVPAQCVTEALCSRARHPAKQKRLRRAGVTHAPGWTKITQPGVAAASAAAMVANTAAPRDDGLALDGAADTRSTLQEALRDSAGLHVQRRASTAAETVLSAAMTRDVLGGGDAAKKLRKRETSETQRWASRSRRLRWWRRGQCVRCSALRVWNSTQYSCCSLLSCKHARTSCIFASSAPSARRAAHTPAGTSAAACSANQPLSPVAPCNSRMKRRQEVTTAAADAQRDCSLHTKDSRWPAAT